MDDAHGIPPEAIWKAADGMRGAYRPEEVCDALLSALYLRMLCGPHQSWRRLVESAYPNSPHFRHEVENVPRSSTYPLDLPREEPNWIATALADAVRQIDGLFGREPSREDLGAAFAMLLDWFASRDARHASESTTPLALRRLMVAIAAPSHGRVYDPAAGVGGSLVEAARVAGGGIEVMGQEINERVRRIGMMQLQINRLNGQILPGNTLQEDRFTELRGDYVLATPPFGVKWDTRLVSTWEDARWPGARSTRNTDLAWLQHCAFHLGNDGVAVVALPVSSTFATGKDEAVRRELLDAGLVRAVISLPPGVFASTGIPVALWVLRRDTPQPGPILIVNASSMGERRASGPVTFGDDDIRAIAGLVDAPHRRTSPRITRQGRMRCGSHANPWIVAAAPYSTQADTCAPPSRSRPLLRSTPLRRSACSVASRCGPLAREARTITIRDQYLGKALREQGEPHPNELHWLLDRIDADGSRGVIVRLLISIAPEGNEDRLPPSADHIAGELSRTWLPGRAGSAISKIEVVATVPKRYQSPDARRVAVPHDRWILFDTDRAMEVPPGLDRLRRFKTGETITVSYHWLPSDIAKYASEIDQITRHSTCSTCALSDL
jgi:hypothetical protein